METLSMDPFASIGAADEEDVDASLLAPSLCCGIAAPNSNPGTPKLMKMNTIGEIRFGSGSNASKKDKKSTAAHKLFKQLSRPAIMKRLNSHTGEHSPEWRTQRLHLDDRSWGDSGTEETPNLLPIPDLSPELSIEENYIRTLKQLRPRLEHLNNSDFIASSEITMQPKTGMDIDSEIIGEGSQGTIFRGRLKSRPDIVVAVKCGWSSSILEEFAMCRRFSHNSILKAIGFSVCNDSLDNSHSDSDPEQEYVHSSPIESPVGPKAPEWLHMAVYEYCPHGDLFNYVKRHPRVSQDIVFIKKIFVGLLSALNEIHRLGYVHCDIKPENILLTNEFEPKVADFGMCQRINDQMIPQGTPSYLAPEVVLAWFSSKKLHSFTSKIDMFSLGCFAVQVVTGKYPFRRATRRLKGGDPFSSEELSEQFTMSSVRYSQLESLSPTLSCLVAACLHMDPLRRPSAEQLLTHLKEQN